MIRKWQATRSLAILLLTAALSVLYLAVGFILLLRGCASSMDDFGRTIRVGEEAQTLIRSEFKSSIPQSVELQQCGFAQLGILGETAEYAVCRGKLTDLVAIAEDFSGCRVDDFETRFHVSDPLVTVNLPFPNAPTWDPGQIDHGLWFENAGDDTGKFVAIDIAGSRILMCKWTD